MASIKAIAGPSGGEGHLQFLTDMPSEGAAAASIALHLHANANVGINNVSPDEKLHISGGGIKVDGEATIASGSGTGVFLDYASNVGRITALDQGTAWRSLRLNAADIQFYIANGEKARIDTSGNFMVGTTSAIDSDSGRGNITLNGSSNAMFNFGVGGSQKGYIYHNGSYLRISNTQSGNLQLQTADTERIRIASDGETTINQNLRIANGGTATAGTVALEVLGQRSDTIEPGNVTAKFYGYSDGDGLAIGHYISAPYGSYLQAGYLLDTYGAPYNNGYPITLNPKGGNVGIGNVANPASKLTLSDTSSNSVVQTRFINDAQNFALGIHGGLSDSFVLYDETNSATRVVVDTSGNIGFNTTGIAAGSTSDSQVSTATPNKFVFNNDYSNGYTDASLKMYLFNSGTTRQGFTSGPAYDLQYHSSGSDAGRHAFHVANEEIFRINKTQVGVGDPSQIANNTTTTFAVRKDNSGGRGGEISIVNYVANAVGNEAALNFGLESSTYHNNDGNAQIKARVMGSSAQTSMIFSNWRGSSFNEAMRINENGTLMVGTSTNATYTHKAHFSGNANIDGIVRIEDVDGTVALSNAVLGLAFSGDNDASNGYFIYMTDGNGAIGSVSVASGTSVNFNTTSDERLKKNIVDASSQLDTIKNIKVREFDWKKNDFHEVGVIAQEIKTVVPNAVKEGGDDETKHPFGVDYGKIVPYLIKAVQEQQTIIEDLKSRVETLEG